MRILIATGIYPPDIGGPATYAYHLRRAFEAAGHTVSVCTYGCLRALPFGVRHVLYACRLLPNIMCADAALALDTVSAGFPAAFLSRLFGKQLVVRAGGDFLWESYIERSGEPVTLPQFYADRPTLSFKERILFRAQRYVLRCAHTAVFNSVWLRDIWKPAYGLRPEKTAIIENPCVRETPLSSRHDSGTKVFLAAGRNIKLKNRGRLWRAAEAAREKDPTIVLDEALSSPDDFAKRLSSARAVIVASLSDVSPNVAYEAVAAGKPFIITKYNGLPERLVSAALTIDPFSEADIRDKILMLADDAFHAEQFKKISALSCDRSWQAVANEFITVLKT